MERGKEEYCYKLAVWVLMAVMLPGTVYGVSWITFRKKGAELVHQSLVWAA